MFATGETAMRFITFDWAPTEINAPVTPAMDIGKVRSHEEVFGSALASYMAVYIADQHKRRTAKIAARKSYFTVVGQFAGWMRGGLPFART
jgi:hypothetical protein